MDYIKGLQTKWQELSLIRKSMIVVLAGCLLLSALLFYHSATKVEYATLFTNLQTESAGKIVEALKEMKVPYKLTDEGATIMIPKDQVYEVRLDLAGKGVVAESGSGFELFNTSDLGATDFERNINYQRALQEELRRSIVQIDAVKQARVHLVLPEKSAFVENQNAPQASIVLELKPFVTLKPAQVEGIAKLVAGAVENLKYEDVNIVDTDGNVLSDNMADNGKNQFQTDQYEIKRAYELAMEKRIKQLLERIYGTNKIVTMVSANMDFNQKQTDSVVWGDQGVVVSEQNSEKTANTTEGLEPVGDPNRVSYDSGLGTTTSSSETSSTRNYEINKMQEQEVYTPGRVTSLSVAVAINGNLTQARETRIKNVVGAAIGYNAQRGDTIDVMSTKFDESALEAEKAAMDKAEADAKRQEQISKWMSWGFKGLGLAALFLLAWVLMRRSRPKDDEWPEIEEQEPVPVQDIEEQIEQMEDQSIHPNDEERIKQIFRNEPEVAVQIINSWLEDSEGEING
ncbi:MAG TPA: flagellar basal-body MS-ring/collar protein FliF [Syntrophomonas sp.]|nr:flagellar basal-body MS-ring/collar protein FliF [Syntrophomonas sp.]